MARRWRSVCWSTLASSTASRSRTQKASGASRSRHGTCAVRWNTSTYVSSSPDCAAMSREPTKPSESLVQQLLAERRELKVALERLKLELQEVRSTVGVPDPRVRELLAEVERLRYQLAH